jgi:glutamate 5-kinase
VARGLVTFAADEVRGMLGRSSGELTSDRRRAVVHRDSLVVLA